MRSRGGYMAGLHGRLLAYMQSGHARRHVCKRHIYGHHVYARRAYMRTIHMSAACTRAYMKPNAYKLAHVREPAKYMLECMYACRCIPKSCIRLAYTCNDASHTRAIHVVSMYAASAAYMERDKPFRIHMVACFCCVYANSISHTHVFTKRHGMYQKTWHVLPHTSINHV